jgi:hypothetical protein
LDCTVGESATHSTLDGWQTVSRVAQDFGNDAASLSRLKAIVGVLTSVAFAYVLGGIVIALQLDLAGYLVQDGMQVIPPQRLLFTGVRELVLSTLVGAILVGVMVAIGAARAPTLVTVLALPAVLMLFVPLNAGGLSWPIALAAVGVGLVVIHRRYARGQRVPPLPVLAGLLIAVTAVTLTRYMVPPQRFVRATVEFKPAEGRAAEHAPEGGFLASNSDFVYVGYRATASGPGSIDAFARETVAAVRLRPPPDERDPQPSLFGLVTGVDVAVTPLLDLWVDDRYEGVQLFR